MKKLFSALLIGSAFFVNAQVTCTADTTNTTYGSTPQADEIPCIQKGVYYEQVVQVLLPSQFTQAEIDSFKMQTVNGLPTGISYVCGNPDCTFYSEKSGCFVIYGTTNDTAKRYDIGFTGKAYIKLNGVPSTFNLNESLAKQAGFDLYLVVIEKDSACNQAVATSVKNIADSKAKFNVSYTADTKKILVQTTNATEMKLEVVIFDLAGKKIYAETKANNANKITIDSEKFSKGMYLIHINGYATKVIIN